MGPPAPGCRGGGCAGEVVTAGASGTMTSKAATAARPVWLPSRPPVGRALWSVGAQGLSSASNSGLQVGLALTMPTRSFGSLVVGLSFYYLALALSRAWVGDPLVALSGPPSPAGPGSRPRAETGRRVSDRQVAVGAAAAVAITLVAVLAASVRLELILLACATPALVVQDGYRYQFWAERAPQRVVLVDGFWVAASIGLVAARLAVVGRQGLSGGWVLGAWLGGGILSWLLAAVITRISTGGARRRLCLDRLPARAGWAVRLTTGRRTTTSADTPAARLADRVGGRSTRRPTDRSAVRMLTWSQVILAVESNGLPVAVAGAAGSTVTAGLRTALLPFLPIGTVAGALRMLALPALRSASGRGRGASTIGRTPAGRNTVSRNVRRNTVGRNTVGRTTVTIVVANLMVAAAFSALGLAVVYAVPEAWLGQTGRLVRPWYPLAAVIVSARLVNLSLSDALSLGADPNSALSYRLGTSALDWVSAIVGAMTFGVGGVIAGRAAAGVVSTGLWVLAVVRAGRTPRPTVAAARTRRP